MLEKMPCKGGSGSLCKGSFIFETRGSNTLWVIFCEFDDDIITTARSVMLHCIPTRDGYMVLIKKLGGHVHQEG